MRIIDHECEELEKWRDGVMTRMRISALNGAHGICIFEQWCDMGLGAPTHLHAVEEILEVMEGRAEVWVDGESAELEPNRSVLIPAGTRHGFRNAGGDVLHVRATLAASVFEASYDDRAEPSRRWMP